MYCARCRQHTANGTRPALARTAAGSLMVKTTCANCGTNKQQFAPGAAKPAVAAKKPVAPRRPYTQKPIPRRVAAARPRAQAARLPPAKRVARPTYYEEDDDDEDDYSDDDEDEQGYYGVQPQQVMPPNRILNRAPSAQRPLPRFNGNNIAAFRKLQNPMQQQQVPLSTKTRVPRKPHAATTQKWQRQLAANGVDKQQEPEDEQDDELYDQP